VERHVKERLVGAAVLMAAAIILIPEMLSGPRRVQEDGEQSAERIVNGSGLRTYTIELNDPGPSRAPTAADDRVSPREQVAAVPRPSEPQVPSAAAPAQSAADREQNAERRVESAPPQAAAASPSKPAVPSKSPEPPRTRPSAPAPSESATRSVATAAAVPTLEGWAVQLGSFANAATAERLAAEFRSTRRDVFVMPVRSGGKTLYRVRIGPMKDRSAAEATLRQVRAKVPAAAVVKHP